MSKKLKYSKLRAFGLYPTIPPKEVACPLCGGILQHKSLSHAVMDGNELWICEKHPQSHTFWVSSWDTSFLNWFKPGKGWHELQWVTTVLYKRRWKMLMNSKGKLIFDEVKNEN